MTIRFAAKVLTLLRQLPGGARGHCECLLHERHWTVVYNACKRATIDKKRKSLLTCQLCASDSTAADDTYDHLFRSCEHPLLSGRLAPIPIVSCSPPCYRLLSTVTSFPFFSICCFVRKTSTDSVYGQLDLLPDRPIRPDGSPHCPDASPERNYSRSEQAFRQQD